MPPDPQSSQSNSEDSDGSTKPQTAEGDILARVAAFKKAHPEIGASDHQESSESASESANNMRQGLKAGTELVGSLLGCGLIGYGFDSWQNTAPIGMLVGLSIGVVVAFWNIYKLTQPVKNPLPEHKKAARGKHI